MLLSIMMPSCAFNNHTPSGMNDFINHEKRPIIVKISNQNGYKNMATLNTGDGEIKDTLISTGEYDLTLYAANKQIFYLKQTTISLPDTIK